jgi:hypothetical protein
VDSDSLMAEELSWPLSENVILKVAYSTYESYKILGLNLVVFPPEPVSGSSRRDNMNANCSISLPVTLYSVKVWRLSLQGC